MRTQSKLHLGLSRAEVTAIIGDPVIAGHSFETADVFAIRASSGSCSEYALAEVAFDTSDHVKQITFHPEHHRLVLIGMHDYDALQVNMTAGAVFSRLGFPATETASPTDWIATYSIDVSEGTTSKRGIVELFFDSHGRLKKKMITAG
jgi:hypothetical protein